MYFIQYTARHLHTWHINMREEFKRVHGKLKTAKVMYEGLMRIFSSLQCGDEPPSKVTYFDSAIDKTVQKAWVEQKNIGCDQRNTGE